MSGSARAWHSPARHSEPVPGAGSGSAPAQAKNRALNTAATHRRRDAPQSDLPLALLLTDPSPNLRRLVLRELMARPADDPEVRELDALRESDALVSDLLRLQGTEGSWKGTDLGGTSGKPSLFATAHALLRLGYLGFGQELAAVRRGVDWLLAAQRADGSWPLSQLAWPGRIDRDRETEGYAMIPLQTALPLRALAACGCAEDARCERAYEWLLSKRLDEGAWPTGIASGVYGGVGGYRRLPGSRWGCRTNTTMALLCLAHHPRRRSEEPARRALDLLLARETRERENLGFEVARLIGAETARGTLTYFARFDLALILDLCVRVGAGASDPRVAALVEWIEEQQGTYGLWEYLPRPPASRWLTFDLLRSLSLLGRADAWVPLEPRLPHRAQPVRKRRY